MRSRRTLETSNTTTIAVTLKMNAVLVVVFTTESKLHVKEQTRLTLKIIGMLWANSNEAEQLYFETILPVL